MKLFFLPIEPYEERYTAQWYEWWADAFNNLGVDFEYVIGDRLTTKIETGQVLDVFGTHFYKFGQLETLMRLLNEGKIKDGDTIFLADLWFPGIEALAYIRNMTGIKFKIAGILHAGTWDQNDFTFKSGMRIWGKDFENSFLEFADKVYVATEYHKRLICSKNSVDKAKVYVMGLPFDSEEIIAQTQKSTKENIVVFPHRLDDEKRPWLFDKLAYEFRKSGWKFVKTKEVCKTKKDYYELLAKSKIAVSFARQETFGYAMLEAVALGCVPVVPDRLSYQEIYPKNLQYADYIQAKKIIEELIKKDAIFNKNKILAKYSPTFVISKILKTL